MNFRELGESGVEVSEVGFGAWVVGTDWWGDRTEEQAIEMLHHAFDRGVTFVDTGDVYGHGRSEELVGKAIDGRRDEVTLGTKVGYDFYNNPQAGHGELPKEANVEYLDEAFERSLERLDVESVDLLQLHNFDASEVTPEVLEWLDTQREQGRVEAVGWALGPSIGWLEEGFSGIHEEFDAVQTVFNMFEQVPGRHFVEEIRETGSDTSLMARVPHSSGLLNEQVTPETELGKGDHRGHRPQAWFETGWEKLENVRFLERDGERTMAQASIQWLLSHPEVSTVTPTFRTTDDIDAWASAPDTPPLSDEEVERVEELYRTNFGVDRDDGMSPEQFRTSVGGRDLEEAGILPKSAGD
ncbi:aldo/keto reductase [Salinirubellus salinus]|uniref:Aldo/keto reductase n=1 Tax=Salinirubellus salinus TaxID=1364945 RepID=A0A9E7R8W0_9EURY|nr:aldo/keto reductase [Salinirubellus salinus]UWM56710.1 aldo/keto reductase [Salinirubellus salinus]